MPGESLMDIELLDNYIHCEYFSMVRREVMFLLTSLYEKNLLSFDYQEFNYSSDSKCFLVQILFTGLYYCQMIFIDRCRSGCDSRFTRGGSQWHWQCSVRLPRQVALFTYSWTSMTEVSLNVFILQFAGSKWRLTRTARAIVLMLDHWMG